MPSFLGFLAVKQSDIGGHRVVGSAAAGIGCVGVVAVIPIKPTGAASIPRAVVISSGHEERPIGRTMGV